MSPELRSRVVAFLVGVPCKCTYLGDGDWIECERCNLLEDFAAERAASSAERREDDAHG